MSRRRKEANGTDGLPAVYWNACELARDGQYEKARAAFAQLERSAPKAGSRLHVLIQNDLAVLAAMEGNLDEACQGWRTAIDSNGECLQARLNLGLVEAERSRGKSKSETRNPEDDSTVPSLPPSSALRTPSSPRVAVLSLLFNWPSTGGGNMHTAGLVDFLRRDGYDVRHFYARYPAWGIGRVDCDAYLRADLQT